jgi:aminopeptidase N
MKFHFLLLHSYGQSIDALLMSISRRIVTPEHEAKILQVLSSLSETLQPTTRASVVEAISKNKQWRSSQKVPAIKAFITKHMDDLKSSEHNLRLPRTSAPISYDLHLKTNVHVGELAVDGEVLIKLRVLEPTSVLTLHARSLNVEELQLFRADGVTEVGIINYSLYSPTDMLTIYMVDEVSTGTELELRVKYECSMNDTPGLYLTGFYITSYESSDGATRYVGAAHFVHTYARTIMPSYDEPLFSAVFKVSITHDESYSAQSNMNGVRRQK